MLSRLWGRLLCMIGLHLWWREDGHSFWFGVPEHNEGMRCACSRPGCEKVHLGVDDRAAVVRAKFEVIEGGGLSDGSLSMADLRVLPPPCAELDNLFDELVASRKPTKEQA